MNFDEIASLYHSRHSVKPTTGSEKYSLGVASLTHRRISAMAVLLGCSITQLASDLLNDALDRIEQKKSE